VRARRAASRKLRDWPHTRRESAPPMLPRSGADAQRFAGDEQSAHDSQPRLPRASGTARGSATHADGVESRRTSLLPLGKVRHRSSGPEELHLQALTEPCLKVSPYTALRGFESAPSREHPVSGSQRFLLVAQLTKAAIEPRHPLRSPSITEASTLLPDDPPSHAAFLLSISRVSLIGFRLASA
jgi:hypothetical protein